MKALAAKVIVAFWLGGEVYDSGLDAITTAAIDGSKLLAVYVASVIGVKVISWRWLEPMRELVTESLALSFQSSASQVDVALAERVAR